MIILLNTRYTQHGFNSIFNTGMGIQLKNKVVFSELSFCSEASSITIVNPLSFDIHPLKPYKSEHCHPLIDTIVIFPALSASSKGEVRPSAHNENK